METILGVIVGFVAFGIIWFFLLKPKDNNTSTDELKIKEEELKIKEEELKKSQIDLARKDERLQNIEDAKKDLTHQLDDKKEEVITVFLALQRQNFALSNSIKDLIQNSIII